MECKPDYVLNLFSVASEAHGYLMALYRDQNKHTAAKDIGERLKIACDEIAANPPAPSPGVTSEQAKCPTCKSDDRSKKSCGGGLGTECPHNHDDCPDPWHGSLSARPENEPARDYDFHGNPPNLPARPELDKDEGGRCEKCGSDDPEKLLCTREFGTASHRKSDPHIAQGLHCWKCTYQFFHRQLASGREKGGL